MTLELMKVFMLETFAERDLLEKETVRDLWSRTFHFSVTFVDKLD